VTALRHVLWIGGAPGAGKTTAALWIARRHGLRWYGADTRTWQHRDRALRAGIVAAHRWESMTPRQRWVGSTPEDVNHHRGALAVQRHREHTTSVRRSRNCSPDATGGSAASAPTAN